MTNTTLNVAYVSLAPFISGAERSLQQLLSHCCNAGIRPLLIVPPESPMMAWAHTQGIPVEACGLPLFEKKNPWPWLLARYRLYRLLKQYRIDIVHSNQIWSFPPVSVLGKYLKIVRVCHFRDPIDERCNWWLRGGLDVAVCISRHITGQLEAYLAPGLCRTVRTIINPVSIPGDLDPEERRRLKCMAREQWNLDPQGFVVGFIGQVAPVKGLVGLLHSLAGLQTRNWVLVVAGNDPQPGEPYLNQCQSLVRSLGLEEQVRFLGFLDNTMDFYHAVDLVAMFSTEEPLGRVPLEAGAYYKPTIAPAVGGLPETIIHQKTGWLVPPGDIQAMTETIAQCIASDMDIAGLAAREWVVSVAEPRHYARTMADLYRASLTGRPSDHP